MEKCESVYVQGSVPPGTVVTEKGWLVSSIPLLFTMSAI